jgi:hypothetical protein
VGRHEPTQARRMPGPRSGTRPPCRILRHRHRPLPLRPSGANRGDHKREAELAGQILGIRGVGSRRWSQDPASLQDFLRYRGSEPHRPAADRRPSPRGRTGAVHRTPRRCAFDPSRRNVWLGHPTSGRATDRRRHGRPRWLGAKQLRAKIPGRGRNDTCQAPGWHSIAYHREHIAGVTILSI